MRLTDLADACRKSGLNVAEVSGWRTRGKALAAVKTIVVHHTATSAAAKGDYPTLGIVRDGRPGIPGPLSQIGLGRTGHVYVIASGKANHAGAVHRTTWGNAYSIGIEAEHPGGSTPWPPGQYDAYVRLCAALVRHYGLTVGDVRGHKEVAFPAGRKTDPNFNMTAFRARVREALAGTSASGSTAPVDGKLVVDGDLGPATVRALEAALKVPETGTVTWRSSGVPQFNASTTVELQHVLRGRALPGDGPLAVDGIMDPSTIGAVQGTLNHYRVATGLPGISLDRDWGAQTTRALQEHLNAHRNLIPGQVAFTAGIPGRAAQ